MAGRCAVGEVLLHRVLPASDAHTAFFWASGADGRLRIAGCQACGHLNHPPGPVCVNCLAGDLAPTTVSGRATVVTFTVNHQPWTPGQHPYVVAKVELVEQPGLVLETNLVDVDGDDVTLGMPVEVVFEQAAEDVWLPLFRPVA